jgi:RNA polymerase sigma-70 factor (ECF subfamily)
MTLRARRPEPGSAGEPSDAGFTAHRQLLTGLAYRMLGSRAEAEDVVQDAFLRWHAADRASVVDPRAFLARVVSRLCLDRMKSARAQREQYVGTWLPEPVIEAVDTGGLAAGPRGAFGADVSFALMMTLERLSPLERAAFLLHDVFELELRDVAEALERSEAACRKLLARGRDHVRDGQPRYHAEPAQTARLTQAFRQAVAAGDLAGFAQMLADDAVFYSDGGGKRSAARNPIVGRDKILRFITGLARKGWMTSEPLGEPVWVNGLPGFVLGSGDDREVLALAFDGARLAAIYSVRNPDKLRALA